MQMFFIIITTVFALIFVLTETQNPTLVEYSEIDARFCGLTQNASNIQNDLCFKWHRNTIRKMSAARNVTPSEAPWVVVVYLVAKTNDSSLWFRCTGTIIDQLWVLTSSQCLNHYKDSNDSLTVHPAYNQTQLRQTANEYEVRQVFKHPDDNPQELYLARPPYDLALLWMAEKIPFAMESNGRTYRTNSICLPERGYQNYRKEYALMAGWGAVLVEKGPKHLQIGHRTIEESIDNRIVTHYPVDDKYRTCSEDIGAPLWQYTDGRAVLIGVQSLDYDFEGQMDEFGCTYQPGRATAVRVSAHINWILKTINDHR